MIIVIFGDTRPDFMEISPILKEIEKYRNISEPILVHIGQHYDYELSRTFFEDLELPESDLYLGIESGPHAKQTGKCTIALEKILFKEKPDLVILVMLIRHWLLHALTAVKLNIPVAHVEAATRIVKLS